MDLDPARMQPLRSGIFGAGSLLCFFLYVAVCALLVCFRKARVLFLCALVAAGVVCFARCVSSHIIWTITHSCWNQRRPPALCVGCCCCSQHRWANSSRLLVLHQACTAGWRCCAAMVGSIVSHICTVKRMSIVCVGSCVA